MCERALWSAVVLQALEDVATAPVDSVDFNAARSFFLASGDWAKQRQWIGDVLNLHADDITRAGRKVIAERGTGRRRPPPDPADPGSYAPLPAPRTRHGSWRKMRTVRAAA